MRACAAGPVAPRIVALMDSLKLLGVGSRIDSELTVSVVLSMSRCATGGMIPYMLFRQYPRLQVGEGKHTQQ